MSKTIGTVTRLFLLDGTKVYLMLRNGKTPGKKQQSSRWIIPGGNTENGETALESVIRETHEEVGVVISPDLLKPLMKRHDPLYNMNMEFFYCSKWEGQVKVMEPEKFDECLWVELKEVPLIDGRGDAHLGVFIKDASEKLLNQLKTPQKRSLISQW